MTWRAFLSMPKNPARFDALVVLLLAINAVVGYTGPDSYHSGTGWLLLGVLYALNAAELAQRRRQKRFAETIQAMSRHLLTCEACDNGPCQVARELSERVIQSGGEAGTIIKHVDIRTYDPE